MSPPIVTARQLNRATLARQGLLEPMEAGPVEAIVSRLGSLQAQHPDWPPFALQVRLAADAHKKIDLSAARQRREVVRASLMRMTVHVVSSADFWPMSTLTLPFRHEQFRAMYRLDPSDSPLARRLAAARPAVLAAMHGGPLSIAEIEGVLRAEIGGVDVPPNRALWRHFSGVVPLVLVPHDTETYGRARYLPAEDWLGAPPPGSGDPAEAAARVAVRYLAAFGPASVEDFAAYVGRGRRVGPLRAAVESLGDRLVRLRGEDGRELVDLVDAPRPPATTPAPPRLLARWDSLLLAYATRHRTRVLSEEHRSTVITRNADVLPTFLLDGQVAGTWLPRRDESGGIRPDLRPFDRLPAADRRALETEAERLMPVLRRGALARYPGTD